MYNSTNNSTRWPIIAPAIAVRLMKTKKQPKKPHMNQKMFSDRLSSQIELAKIFSDRLFALSLSLFLFLALSPLSDSFALQICSQKTFIFYSLPELCFLARSLIKTYPADCRKIAAVDSNKHDWD